MAWTASAIFQQAMLNPIGGRCWSTAVPASYGNLSADTINVSLFNSTATPDKTAALASTLWNTGVWVNANEVTDATNWVLGGRALASKTFAIDTGSSSVCFTAANLSGGGNVTIANAYGCLVYDATITGTPVKQGLCYNYFGGAQGVTAGPFTIIWPSVGATTAVFNLPV